MYAVVQIAGKQYKVRQNDTIQVPTLDEKTVPTREELMSFCTIPMNS